MDDRCNLTQVFELYQEMCDEDRKKFWRLIEQHRQEQMKEEMRRNIELAMQKGGDDLVEYEVVRQPKKCCVIV